VKLAEMPKLRDYLNKVYVILQIVGVIYFSIACFISSRAINFRKLDRVLRESEKLLYETSKLKRL